MAFNFSKEFREKYLTGSTDMPEIIDKAQKYVDDVEATDYDKELIFKSLYAFKHTIAETAGIDMDIIYPRIENLKGIYSQSSWGNALASCEISDDTNDKPIKMIIRPSIAAVEDDFHDRVILHEMAHVYSDDIRVENGKYVLRCTNIQSATDEVWTEGSSIIMAKYLGYEIELQKYSLSTRHDDIFRTAFLATESTGYTDIINSFEFFKLAYGEELIWREKYLGDGIIHQQCPELAHSDALLSDAAGGRNISKQLDLQQQMMDVCIKKWEIDETFSIDDYLRDVKTIYDKGVHFGHCEVDNKDTYFRAVSTYMQAFEISHFYSQLHGIDNSVEIAREINPLTRSEDCKTFLAVMEALKHSDIRLSQDSFMDMKYKRIESPDGPMIEIIIDRMRYQTNYSYNEILGIAGHSDMEDAKLTTKMASLFSRSVTEGEGISFIDIKESEKYTGCIRYLANYCELNSSSIDSKSALIFSAAGNESFFKSDKLLERVIQSANLENIRDSYGNNLLHLLAINTSDNSRNILKMICDHQPEAFAALAQERNNNGQRAIDIAVDVENLGFLRTTVQHFGISEIMDRLTEDKKAINNSHGAIPVGMILFESKDPDFILNAFKEGINPNCTDAMGRNVLHLCASGELPADRIHEFVNAGANINALGMAETTPLSIAIKNRDIETVSKLLTFGADPNELYTALRMDLPTGMGASDVLLFELKKQYSIFNKLVDAGANVDSDKYGGYTLLQKFGGVQYGNPDYHTVEILLEAGASPLRRGSGSDISLKDYACKTGDVKLFTLMLEAGYSSETLCIEGANLCREDKESLINMARVIEESRHIETTNDKIINLDDKATDFEMIKDDADDNSKIIESITLDSFEI